MGNQQRKLESKPQQQKLERDHELPKKAHNLDGNKEPTDILESTTSITNIYYDCLEHIFGFLGLDDLLSVAQTCKRLQIAATANFTDYYGDAVFLLVPKDDDNDYVEGIWYIGDDDNDDDNDADTDVDADAEYEVVGLKFCLPFLRCFGSKLLHLEVVNSSVPDDCINRYINQYCADTLTGITHTDREQKFSDESFRKPFKNVETVTIFDCNNFNQLSNFVDWFPNLRNLEMDSQSIRHCKPIHFPLLECLCMGLDCDPIEDSIKVFEGLLHANKQLNAVTFWFGNDIRFTVSQMLDKINENRLISNLKIGINEDVLIDVNGSELLRLINEQPKMVKLNLQECLLDVGDVIAFIGILGLLNRLKFFKFRVKTRSESDRLITKLDEDSTWKYKIKLDEDNVDHHIITLTRENRFE